MPKQYIFVALFAVGMLSSCTINNNPKPDSNIGQADNCSQSTESLDHCAAEDPKPDSNIKQADNDPQAPTDPDRKIIKQADNCPQAPSEPPIIKLDSQESDFYSAFKYQIRDIVADEDAIAFKSSDYKFTWCRGNNNWTVENIENPDNNNIESGQYQNFQFQDRTYQYRVKLNPDSPTKARQVILELITPQATQAQSQVLYTLEQTKQAKAGIELGAPEISTPIVYGDRLFWYVYTYHGEGFGGIATIVSYSPSTDETTVIQPPEIANQVINDLTITGQLDNPTFWIATQLTGEGNPYLPSLGLVAYRPSNPEYTKGTIDSYRVDNSPIVGAIPTKLYSEDNKLWIGTGNGICQVNWQNIKNSDWSCWRFAPMAKLPDGVLPVYSSLLDNTPDAAITPQETDAVEILWWSLYQRQPVKGRYEIKYNQPMTVELSDRGATTWNQLYNNSSYQPSVWQPPLYWAGNNWHWKSNKFIRGLDEVPLNMFGGGPMGIGSQIPNDDYIFDINTIRGDLELLELTKDTTKVRHYSAWVEDNLLQPYLTIVPQSKPTESQPNPLLKIKSQSRK